MKKIAFMSVLFIFAALICGQNTIAGNMGLGEELERQMWVDFKNKNWDTVETKLADGFQSLHQDGARNRAEEMTLLRNLNVGKYTLSDFKETRSGSTIVVSYFISVEETIRGKVLSTKPAARQSVWIMTEKGWQWLTHVNMNPLK